MTVDIIQVKGTLAAPTSPFNIDTLGLFGPAGTPLGGDTYTITISFDPASLTEAAAFETMWSGSNDVTSVIVDGRTFTISDQSSSFIDVLENVTGAMFGGTGIASSGTIFPILELDANFEAYDLNEAPFGDSLQSFSDQQPLAQSTATIDISQIDGVTMSDISSDELNGPVTSVSLSSDACFCRGTLIRTDEGDTPVERLEIGDNVLTKSAKPRKIVWIGVGRVLVARGRRNAATPVIVRKGALGDNVPTRDLHVTRAHGIFIDNALIPAEYLVNHRSIIWDDHAQEVEIYHIELETHDVLIANGAPAESYRDDGNRWLFQNANSGWHLPPRQPCAPVLTGGPIVDTIWRRLLKRSGSRPGLVLTDDPDLHLLVDGRRLEPALRHGDAYIFRLQNSLGTVRVASHAAVPAELGVARDPRVLGVALTSIVLRQETRFRIMEASDTSLTDGFHSFEPDGGMRWTNGDATLPAGLFDGFDGPTELVLHVACSTQYPMIGDHPRRDAA